MDTQFKAMSYCRSTVSVKAANLYPVLFRTKIGRYGLSSSHYARSSQIPALAIRCNAMQQRSAARDSRNSPSDWVFHAVAQSGKQSGARDTNTIDPFRNRYYISGMITINEAKKIAGVTSSYLRRLLRDNRIKGKKISPRLWLVDVRSLNRWLASRS